MPSGFALPANNVVAIVGPNYTAGSGTLTVASGQGNQFGTLSASQFYRITVCKQADAYNPQMPASSYTILKATARSGDTFTGCTVIEGTTDRNYIGGDIVDVRVTAGTLADIQGAINTIETRNAATCQGRLTLISGDPLGINAPSGSGTTLYFSPYKGNLIALYNGSTGWDTIGFNEVSMSVPATQGVYDIFGFNSGGTLVLTPSAAWSVRGENTGADGTRAEAIGSQDGIYVKASDHTRRYLGTIYTAGGSAVDAPGSVGVVGQRNVWNYYNRVRKQIYTEQNVNSWTYNQATWRPFNNNLNSLSIITYVVGFREDYMDLMASTYFQAPANGYVTCGIGFDGGTSASVITSAPSAAGGSSLQGGIVASISRYVPIGWHLVYGTEFIATGTTTTFLANGAGTYIQAYLWC